MHVYQAVVGLQVVARSASSEEVNRVLRATTRSSIVFSCSRDRRSARREAAPPDRHNTQRTQPENNYNNNNKQTNKQTSTRQVAQEDAVKGNVNSIWTIQCKKLMKLYGKSYLRRKSGEHLGHFCDAGAEAISVVVLVTFVVRFPEPASLRA